MDNSTFQMHTVNYYGVITEDSDSLITALFFDRKFKGLCNEGNLTVFHWNVVEIIRIKSNGNIAIRGQEHEVLELKEIFDITVPQLQGNLNSEELAAKPFEGKTKRNYEGVSIDRSTLTDNRELIRTFKKRINFLLEIAQEMKTLNPRGNFSNTTH